MPTPKLRFPGFTGDWERHKLEDCLEIVNNKNGNTYTREDVLAVSDTYGCVNQIKFHGRSFAGEDISDYKIVQSGDIIYTKSPLQSKPFGIIKIVEGNSGIVSPLYIVNKPNDNCDSTFLYYLFDTPERTNNYLGPLVRKGAKNTMNISNDEWLSGNVVISANKHEQHRIGAFFKCIDNLITLYQRKYDELQELKKSMLQKMFPKEGEKVPEIRFLGFTGDWEQCKLGEVCSKIGDGLHSAPIYDDSGKYYFINGNNLANGTIQIDDKVTKKVSFEIFKQNDKYLDKSTILMSINGTIGNLAYYQGEKVMLGKSVAYLKAGNIDKSFLFILLQTSTIMNDFMLSLTGTTIKNLGLETIKNTCIQIPKKDEQIKIGSYFSNLDNLITLHQRKCDELKELKKGMLQQMFC